MLIAQCNGCRIMKPSLFTVVPFKPHYHSTILSVISRQDKVDSCFVLCCCYFGSQKNGYDPVVFATAAPTIIPLGNVTDCCLLPL